MNCKKVLIPILFLLTLFTSCQNFMNGGKTKEELEQQIAYSSQENPLKVVSYTPGNGEYNVTIDTPIVIHFNKAINKDSFALTVKSSYGEDYTNYYYSKHSAMDKELNVSNEGKSVWIHPEASSLKTNFNRPFCEVTVTLDKNICDTDGFKIDREYSWTFVIIPSLSKESVKVHESIFAKTQQDLYDTSVSRHVWTGYNLAKQLTEEVDYTKWHYFDYLSNHLNEVWVSLAVSGIINPPYYVRCVLNPIKSGKGKIYRGPENHQGIVFDFQSEGYNFSKIEFKCIFYGTFRQGEDQNDQSGMIEMLADNSDMRNYLIDWLEIESNTKEAIIEAIKNSSNMFSLDLYIFDTKLNCSKISRTIIYDGQGPVFKKGLDKESFATIITDAIDYTEPFLLDVTDNWWSSFSEAYDYNTQYFYKVDGKDLYISGIYYRYIKQVNVSLQDENGNEICSIFNTNQQPYYYVEDGKTIEIPADALANSSKFYLVATDICGNVSKLELTIPGNGN